MNKKPFFSLIIPTLNEEKYLPLLLDDLSKQTFQDFEVIVVDGLSKDKTLQIATSFTNKLSSLTIATSNRQHVCTQRNLGATKAKGKFLIFSDADNRLPSYFLLGLKYKIEFLSADIITPWFKPDKSNRSNDTLALGMNLALELQKTLSNPMMLESLIAIKKQSFQKIGGFDESINYAEGRQFAEGVLKSNLNWSIVKDPAYQFSFRRFRKFGILKLMKNTTALGLSNLLGKDYKNRLAQELYPMVGGTLFNKPKKQRSKFAKTITGLLKKIDDL